MSSDNPIVHPRLSAAVLMLRDTAAGVQVLMARRQPHLKFLGGYWVFPGGMVDLQDSNIAIYGDAKSRGERASAALYIAAARELFEETGILLDGAATFNAHSEGEPSEGNSCESTSSTSFAAALPARGFDISRLRLWARWITPSASARRYDTYFFIAEMTSEREPKPNSDEIESLKWVCPAQWADADTLTRNSIAPPTQLMLRELAEEINVHGSLRSVFESAGAKKIGVVLPKIIRQEPLTVVFPWDPEYETFPGESLPWDSSAYPDRSRWPARLSIATASPKLP